MQIAEGVVWVETSRMRMAENTHCCFVEDLGFQCSGIDHSVFFM